MSAHLRAEAVLRVFERGPFPVPSAVEGAGEGSAGDKFRVSGTKEMVEGAGANKESEVLSEASCCRCGTSNFTKERPTSFLYPLHGTAHAFRVKYQSRVVKNGTKCKKV